MTENIESEKDTGTLKKNPKTFTIINTTPNSLMHLAFPFNRMNSAVNIPVFFSPKSDIGTIIDKIKGYLDDPSTLVTGPRTTGSRDDAVTNWKARCRDGDC